MSIAQDLGQTSLVDILGPAEDRYFASGYKNVRYDVRTVEAVADAPGEVRAVCSARYPRDWSRGADGAVRTPHLSSVDAIALSILVVERFVGASAFVSHRIARVELRAPKQPHNDLTVVPVSLRIDGDPSQAGVQIGADVAGLRVHLELLRDGGDGVRIDADGPSVYATGFRSTRIASFLEAGDTTSSVGASHLFEAGSESFARSTIGVESAFAPAVTAIDLLVTLGQMTQAAIYLSIPIDQRRGDLWMRSMMIDVDGPPQPLPFSGRSVTKIVRDRILDRDGRRLHDIDVESSLAPSVRARARLAYIEPTASTTRGSENA